MLFIADFHIHSKYSYATSKDMDLQQLAIWGQLKGIGVMGTGDFTHPLWRQELHEQLEPAELGLYQLKKKYQQTVDEQVYDSCKASQRFLLTSEISTLFYRGKKCYQVHCLLFAPSLQVADQIAEKLRLIGNIAYDGRPMLQIDIVDLLKLVLHIDQDCMLVPAHIWAPHFGLLGSKASFDSVQECFGDMTSHIYAIEKGLSGSYFMNAQVSSLDQFAILANSDAHSVQKLGREATVFDTDVSYFAIMQALKSNDSTQIIAGIEYFPELGKYYGSGHRNCQMYLSPEQSLVNPICSVCGKKVTIGVGARVALLADRNPEQALVVMRRRYQIAPLLQIIADHVGFAVTSKKVQRMYYTMLAALGNEFYILLDANLDDIAQAGSKEIAASIDAMRQGKVILTPGYDGVYGTITF